MQYNRGSAVSGQVSAGVSKSCHVDQENERVMHADKVLVPA